MKNMKIASAVLVGLAGASVASAGGTTILSDNFDGIGGALNGAAADVGGNWTASAGWGTDGAITATEDSAALLATGGLSTNSQYMMSGTINNMTSQWIAMGFARDNLEAPGGVVQFNDRHSNELEGAAWMLVRNDPARNDVEAFGGLRTGGNLVGGDFGIDFGSPVQLDILIDTTGDGSSFTADFFVNGTSLLGGMTQINVSVADLNFAGFSFDYGGGDAVSVSSFSLTQVPAPASLGLVGLGGLAASRRRR